MEDEERIIGFCKNIEGYNDMTEFQLEGILRKVDDDNVYIDTMYISDNLGYLDMIIVIPVILVTELRDEHFSNYEFENE